MLAHRQEVAPHASFVVGRAGRLPFADRSFELVAAAGSLNYADCPQLSLRWRVLIANGTFLPYDFSTGRRSAHGDKLADWFALFEQRFPKAPDRRPLDVRKLPLAEHGLRLLEHVEVEPRLSMTLDSYLRYMLSEANVNDTITRGLYSTDAAQAWCQETLKLVFAGGEATHNILWIYCDADPRN
jgi:hypothetical protein